MAITAPMVMLESGDRLSRAEFHRRYELRTDLKRAELVQGVVYVPSPTRYGVHDEQQADIAVWLGIYAARTTGVKHGLSATIYLAEDSELQPDDFLLRVPPPNANAPRRPQDSTVERS